MVIWFMGLFLDNDFSVTIIKPKDWFLRKMSQGASFTHERSSFRQKLRHFGCTPKTEGFEKWASRPKCVKMSKIKVGVDG